MVLPERCCSEAETFRSVRRVLSSDGTLLIHSDNAGGPGCLRPLCGCFIKAGGDLLAAACSIPGCYWRLRECCGLDESVDECCRFRNSTIHPAVVRAVKPRIAMVCEREQQSSGTPFQVSDPGPGIVRDGLRLSAAPARRAVGIGADLQGASNSSPNGIAAPGSVPLTAAQSTAPRRCWFKVWRGRPGIEAGVPDPEARLGQLSAHVEPVVRTMIGNTLGGIVIL